MRHSAAQIQSSPVKAQKKQAGFTHNAGLRDESHAGAKRCVYRIAARPPALARRAHVYPRMIHRLP